MLLFYQVEQSQSSQFDGRGQWGRMQEINYKVASSCSSLHKEMRVSFSVISGEVV